MLAGSAASQEPVSAPDLRREALVAPAGGPSVRPSGHGSATERARRVLASLVPPLSVVLAWEALARSGRFNATLVPPVGEVVDALIRLTLSGVLPANAAYTLYRLGVGFAIAATFGLVIGLAMARYGKVEGYFAPLISMLLPIPALAWVPLFMLWFGLSDTATIALVIFAATLPIIFNTWTGVKTINEVSVRAAQSMNCHGLRLFVKVIAPASLPFVLTGLRIGFAQAWRAVVAGEMIAASSYGLGLMIFTAREFLNTDVMLAGIAVIGAVGLLLEKFTFQWIERRTVIKWGMLRDAGG